MHHMMETAMDCTGLDTITLIAAVVGLGLAMIGLFCFNPGGGVGESRELKNGLKGSTVG